MDLQINPTDDSLPLQVKSPFSIERGYTLNLENFQFLLFHMTWEISLLPQLSHRMPIDFGCTHGTLSLQNIFFQIFNSNSSTIIKISL